MRNDEIALGQAHVPVEQEVDVDRTGTPARSIDAAECLLDGARPLEDLARRQARLDGDARVEERRLLGETERRRLVDR
jgi:hypothetical protein